jgi:hypothetical protein
MNGAAASRHFITEGLDWRQLHRFVGYLTYAMSQIKDR